MPKTRVCAVLSVVAMLAGAAMAGGHRLPDRFAPTSLDGTPVVVDDNARGRTWSAWAYRNGGEYDIAVSVLDGSGVWSEPTFLGLDDGLDQVQPALAVDSDGTVYLAFAVRGTRAILLATLPAGARGWAGPFPVVHTDGFASAPALLLVGDHVVVAFRDGEDVGMTSFRRAAPRSGSTFGVQEGPDVIDPLGRLPTADADDVRPPEEDEVWSGDRRRTRGASSSFGPRRESGDSGPR